MHGCTPEKNKIHWISSIVKNSNFFFYFNRFNRQNNFTPNVFKTLTFLNVSRLIIILPKHSRPIDCCVVIITIGSICCIFNGIKYQSNWLILSLISSNAEFIRPASSHATSSNINEKISSTIEINSTNESFCDWNPNAKRNSF